MRKIKRLSLALVCSFVLLMAAGCSCSTDTTVDDNGNNQTSTRETTTTNNGGLVDDIGDGIENGITDMKDEYESLTKDNTTTGNRIR